MLSKFGEQIYIAELRVPTCFYPSRETRYPLQHPAGFQVRKGYYAIRPPKERFTLGGYIELVLVLEFLGQDLKEAEEHALKVGGMFGSAAAAFGGYPLELPYLDRIAHIGANNHLKSQHDYSYGVKPYILYQFDHEGGHQFSRYLQSLSSIDATTRHQLESAIHWYGICVSADDPAVSYVSAWTGLESIGTIIHQKAHPNGSRAHCKTCGNVAGEERDRKKAGIDHMFKLLIDVPKSVSLSDKVRHSLARDFTGELSSKEANDLRDSIVHGLGDIESLVQKSSRSRMFLAHALNAAIQTVMGDHVKSWMPGDYGPHPNARYSFRFKDGFTNSPYLGEWAAVLHTKAQPNIPEYPVDVDWILHESAAEFIEFQSQELFSRGTNVYDLATESEVTGLPNWHDRPSEPLWKEYTGVQLN